MEVKAAEIAVKAAQNGDVKHYAETMMTDHSKANTELDALARRKGVETPTKLSSANEQKLQSLTTQQGASFDAAYMQAMVRDHEETVALFESQANSGKDTEVQTWAKSKLPVLRHHLEMARELQQKVKNTGEKRGG